MEKRNRTFSTVLLQIALALLFIVSGIWIFMGYAGDEISIAINSIFKGNAQKVILYVFAVIELIVGAFLILRIFLNLNTKLDTALMTIIMICWIVAIILLDFVGKAGLFKCLNSAFLGFLYRFAGHLLVLGAIIKVRN